MSSTDGIVPSLFEYIRGASVQEIPVPESVCCKYPERICERYLKKDIDTYYSYCPFTKAYFSECEILTDFIIDFDDNVVCINDNLVLRVSFCRTGYFTSTNLCFKVLDTVYDIFELNEKRSKLPQCRRFYFFVS